MPYKELSGNLFSSKAQALVNTVNCVGAMGKGIALEFRRRYPQMYLDYQKDCQEKKLLPGKIYHFQAGEKLILNFAIKDHWKYPSKVAWIESCLREFVSGYKGWGITSAAFPWMGAMNGGIPFDIIQALTRRYLQNLQDIDIEVYSFVPDAYDPLFESLKEIAVSEYPEKYLYESGLQKSAYLKVMYTVKNCQVKGLAGFSEDNIIGSISIDKLYAFLVEYPKIKEKLDNNYGGKATQLSWLDE